MMDILTIYGITAGGIFAILFLSRALASLRPRIRLLIPFISQHLTYPYFVDRHRFAGPWARASVVLHSIYTAVNVFLVYFGVTSIAEAGLRAGTLSLINLIILVSAGHLSHLADLLGISLRTCRQIHRAAGWIVVALLTFHVSVALAVQEVVLPGDGSRNLFTWISTGALGTLALFSLPFIRYLSYEVFLRTHQALAGICVYGIWRHIPADGILPRLYLYIALGLFVLTSVVQLLTFLYWNGLFAGRGYPRAVVSCSHARQTEKKTAETVTAINICLILPQPIKIRAGQYINLWMPSVGPWSWAQSHPFMVTSWSHGKQDTLNLLLQPRGSADVAIVHQACAIEGGSISFLAFFTGPHGISQPVDQYESVLVIASGFGIAAVIPYLQNMIYGYNTCTSHTRRLHFLWQVESLDLPNAAEELLNTLLDNDILDNGYILTISIFITERYMKQDRQPFGKHKRAFLYNGVPDYSKIISLEAAGDQIERHPNIRNEHGQMLVMGKAAAPTASRILLLIMRRPVSTSNELRDQLRGIVRGYLHQRVKMLELEFQP